MASYFDETAENAYLLVLLSQAVNKASGAEKLQRDFEKAMVAVNTAEWNSLSNEAVRTAMATFRGRGSRSKRAKSINSKIARIMSKFGKKVTPKTKKMITLFYRDMAKRFIKEFGLKIEKASQEIGEEIVFSLKDKKAIEVIGSLSVQTAGRYFPESIERLTSEVVDEVVLNEGFTKEQAAVKLQAEVEAALGVQAAQAIPTRFQTNPAAYFQTVATNATTQAVNVGRILSMADAGVEIYEVRAVLDRQTTPICNDLDGKRFSVGGSVRVVDDFLRVKSLAGLETLMPFTSQNTVPGWANRGLGFPPYHHRCRSVVVPIVL